MNEAIFKIGDWIKPVPKAWRYSDLVALNKVYKVLDNRYPGYETGKVIKIRNERGESTYYLSGSFSLAEPKKPLTYREALDKLEK